MMKDYATVKETYIARYPHSFSASGRVLQCLPLEEKHSLYNEMLLELRGLRLVTNFTGRTKDKHEVLCIFCNNTFSSSLTPLLNTRGCPCTHNKKAKLCVEDIHKRFLVSIFNCYSVVPSTVNVNTVLQVECPVGHITSKTVRSLLYSTRGCKECAVNKKLTKEEVESHIALYGYTLKNDDWGLGAGENTRISLVCSKGHDRETSISNFRSGYTTCPQCSLAHRSDILYMYSTSSGICKVGVTTSSLPYMQRAKGTCSRWKHRIVNYYEWQLDPLITKAHETSFKKQFRTGVIPNLDGYTEMWYEKDLKFDDALSIVTEKLGDSLRSFNG